MKIYNKALIIMFFMFIAWKTGWTQVEMNYTPEHEIGYLKIWVDDLRSLHVSYRGINVVGFWPGIYSGQGKTVADKITPHRGKYIYEGEEIWNYWNSRDIPIEVTVSKERVEYVWRYNEETSGFRQTMHAVLVPEKVITDVTLEFSKQPPDDFIYFPAFFPGARIGPTQGAVTGNSRIDGKECIVTYADGTEDMTTYPAEEKPSHWLWKDTREIVLNLGGEKKVRLSFSASDQETIFQVYSHTGHATRDWLSPMMLCRISMPARKAFLQKGVYRNTLHLEVAVDNEVLKPPLSPNPVEFNDDVKVRLNSDALANVFLWGQNKEFKVELDNYLNQRDRAVKVNLKATDFYDKEIWTDSFDVTLPSGKTINRQVLIPDIGKGIFTLSAQVLEGGKMVGCKNIRIGIVPEPSDVRPDESFFGAMTRIGCFDNNDIKRLETFYALVHNLGIKRIRYIADWRNRWPYAEKTQGNFNFNPFTLKALDALRKNGISPYLCGEVFEIDSQFPDWALGDVSISYRNYGGYGTGKQQMPKDFSLVEQYTHEFAKFVGDRIDIYELENEPVLGQRSDEEQEILNDFRRRQSLGVRKANPEARIVSAYYAWDVEKILKMTQEKDKRIYDIMAPHYLMVASQNVASPASHLEEPENYFERVKNLAEVCKKYGVDLWNGEDGFFMSYHGIFPGIKFPACEREFVNYSLRSHILQRAAGVKHVNLAHALPYYGTGLGPDSLPNLDVGLEFNAGRGGEYFGVAGNIKSNAIAYAILASVLDGTEFRTKVSLNLPGAWGLVFERKSSPIGFMWMTGEEAEIELDLSDDEVDVLNIMGNKVNEKGTTKFKLTAEPVYLVGKGIAVERMIKAMEECSYNPSRHLGITDAVLSNNGEYLKIWVRNFGTSERKLEKVQVQVENKNFTVQPEEVGPLREKILNVKMVPPLKDDSMVEVIIKTDGQEIKRTIEVYFPEISHCQRKGYLVIRHIKEPPVIDGVMEEGEWNYTEPVLLVREEQVYVADENKKVSEIWRGPNDLSGEVYLLWDENNLYICVQRTDDIWYNPYGLEDKAIPQGDGVEMAMDVYMDSQDRFNSDDHFMGMTLSSKGPYQWRRSFNNPNVSPEGPIPGAQLAVGKWEKGLIFEFKVPLKQLHPLKAVEGMAVRFNIVLDDNDGQGRKCWLGITRGLAEKRDPSVYKKVVFVN